MNEGMIMWMLELRGASAGLGGARVQPPGLSPQGPS